MDVWLVMGMGMGTDYYDTDQVWAVCLSEAGAIAEVRRLSALAIEQYAIWEKERYGEAWMAHETEHGNVAGVSFSIDKREAKP